MECLKDKGVELHKGVYKKVWLEKDVKEAVLGFVKDYWSESDDSFDDLIKKHFGDWED